MIDKFDDHEFFICFMLVRGLLVLDGIKVICLICLSVGYSSDGYHFTGKRKSMIKNADARDIIFWKI